MDINWVRERKNEIIKQAERYNGVYTRLDYWGASVSKRLWERLWSMYLKEYDELFS